MFHLSAYSQNIPLGNNQSLTAPVDQVLTTRNSHLIFTEQWELLSILGIGSNVTRLRFNDPQFTVRAIPHLWPVNRSATIANLVQPPDYRMMPLQLPQNEELIIEVSTDGPAMGNAISSAVLLVAPPSWNMNLPQGEGPYWVRGTAVVVAGAASDWTALTNITFERDLFNGVYAVVGCYVVAAGSHAFRLRFPTAPTYGGKALRPGGFNQELIANFPWGGQNLGMGEWGRFHTFETLQLQTFNDVAGGTYDVRLAVVYLGQSKDLLNYGMPA